MIASLKDVFFGSNPLEFDSDTVKIGGYAQDFTRCGETEQPETARSKRKQIGLGAPLPQDKRMTQRHCSSETGGGCIRRFKRIDWIRTPPIPTRYDALRTKYWLDRDGRRNCTNLWG
jgi:hypothetical protein